MPITLQWHNADQTILFCRVEGEWNWTDFRQAFVASSEAIQSLEHVVHVMIEMVHGVACPPASPFPHLGRALRQLPANLGLLTIITQKSFVKMTVAIVTKMHEQQDRFFVVTSSDEAEAILFETIERERYKARLISALGGDNHALATRVIEELRNFGWLNDGSLCGVNLSGANLRSTNLFFANLSAARLDNTNLHSANLFMSNLERANLQYADLREANLEQALLSRANLRGANFDTHTVLPDGTLWRPQSDLLRFTHPGHPHFWYSMPQSGDDSATLPDAPYSPANS